MTIEEMKQRFVDGTLENGLYTSKDKIVKIFNNGFSISTPQENGWSRVNIYEYLDNQWIESETYER